jgi:hypothetical protein
VVLRAIAILPAAPALAPQSCSQHTTLRCTL